MADTTNSAVESTSDFGGDPEGLAKRWIDELTLAEKEMKRWDQNCEKIIRRYRDDRQDSEVNIKTRIRRFNILWSNVETQKSILYSRDPLPIVERRFADQDPTA